MLAHDANVCIPLAISFSPQICYECLHGVSILRWAALGRVHVLVFLRSCCTEGGFWCCFCCSLDALTSNVTFSEISKKHDSLANLSQHKRSRVAGSRGSGLRNALLVEIASLEGEFSARMVSASQRIFSLLDRS